jgi:hypothetical protein
MATFVLDENVIVFATTRTNQLGDPDTACVDLVIRILEPENNHRLAWSVEVNRRWTRKADALQAENRAIDPTFMHLFALVSFSDKCVFPERGNPPALAGEDRWSTKLLDDVDFVRLAAFFSAILSTTDTPLKLEVESLGLDRVHSFQVWLVGDCLLYVRGSSL